MKLHHAIVIEGEGTTALAHAYEHIRNTLSIHTEANPDVAVLEVERLTIHDARTLRERAGQQPLGDAQVFILVCEQILREAQNALLKLFEEPAPNTYFVLILPTVRHLLPTVQSRLSYGGRVAAEIESGSLARDILTAPIGERIKLLGPILKEKDRKAARMLLDALEVQLHTDGVTTHAQQLKEIAFAKQYIADRSSSLKMLLEHVLLHI